MLIVFTSICFFGLVYSYAGYPLLLWVINLMCLRRCNRTSNAPVDGLTNLPTLSVLITAHNEEGHIAEKIENTLEAVAHFEKTTGQNVEVIVASDGSKDGTDLKVKSFEGRGVKLVRLEPAAGKERAQKKALEHVVGDVVVFTDAKVKIAENSLVKFAQYFVDPLVGAVSSVDRVEGLATEGSGEGFYVRYEMWLRSLESRFGSLVGLSGSFFAVRRELTRELRVELPSDFALLLSVKKMGLKGVHAEDVIHTYRAVKTEEQEFSRKVRTVLRGITTVLSVREVLNPFVFGLFSWQIFSHKVCRWLVPFFGLGAWLGSWLLAPTSMFFLVVVLGGALLLALAFFGYFVPTLRNKVWVKIPLFFVVSNMAILMAWMLFASGKRSVRWQPTTR